MIAGIIKILQSDNFYGGGVYVETAKGKNQRVTTFKKGIKKIKRCLYARK